MITVAAWLVAVVASDGGNALRHGFVPVGATATALRGPGAPWSAVDASRQLTQGTAASASGTAPFRAAVNVTVTFGVGALRANQTLAMRLLSQSCLGALLRLSLVRAAGGSADDMNATAIDLMEVVPGGGNSSAALYSEAVPRTARANVLGYSHARSCSGRSLVESCAEDACNGEPIAVVLVRTRLRIALYPPPAASQLLTDDVAATVQWPADAAAMPLTALFRHRMARIFVDDVPYNITIGAFEAQWFNALVFSPSFDTTWEVVSFASAVKLSGVEVGGGGDDAASTARRQASDAATVLGILLGIAAVALVGCFACKAQAAHHDQVASACREADWGGIAAAGRPPLTARGRGRGSVLSAHAAGTGLTPRQSHWTTYPRLHGSWSRDEGGSDGGGALELRLPTATLAAAAAVAAARRNAARVSRIQPRQAPFHHTSAPAHEPAAPAAGNEEGADPIAVHSRSTSSNELPGQLGSRPASHSFSYFAHRRPRLLGSVVSATSSAESELRAIAAGVIPPSSIIPPAATDVSPTLHHIVDADVDTGTTAGADVVGAAAVTSDDPGRASRSTGSARRSTDPGTAASDRDDGCGSGGSVVSHNSSPGAQGGVTQATAAAPAPTWREAVPAASGRRPRAGTA